MKKKFLCMLLAGVMTFSFAACGKDENNEDNNNPSTTKQPAQPSESPSVEPSQAPATEVNFSVKELLSGILEKAAGEYALMEVGDTEVTELYGIDLSKVKEYSLQVPMMNVHATEFAMFEAASTEDVSSIVDGVNSRIASLTTTWQQYLPDQYELVENNKVLVQGNYVFFIVAEEDVAAYAENVFLRQFDPSIEEVVLQRKFNRLEDAVITAISEDSLTVELQEEGATYVFECTYSEYFYAEGELSSYTAGDHVLVVFEDNVVESSSPMRAAATYLSPVEN